MFLNGCLPVKKKNSRFEIRDQDNNQDHGFIWIFASIHDITIEYFTKYGICKKYQ